MHSLTGKSEGCVLVDGQPFQLGDLRVSYDNNTVTIKEKLNTGSSLIVSTFDQITNGAGGDPFGSMAALKDFIQSNFFADAPVKGGAFNSTVTVATYAEMIAMINTGKVTSDINFRVTDDEKYIQHNTTYTFYSKPANNQVLMRTPAVLEQF